MDDAEKLAQSYRDYYGERAMDVAMRDWDDGSLTWKRVLEILSKD